MKVSKKKPERKKKGHRVLLLVGIYTVVGFNLGILSILLLALNAGTLLEMSAGCVGTGNFYSNTTFNDDLGSIYMHSNITLGEPLRTPQDLWDGQPVDCETISTTIMCLSYLYEDTECVYYQSIPIDPTGMEMGHLGIRCRFRWPDESWSEWITRN